MYYNERINYVDGILECQTMPRGPWRPCTGVKADAVKLFLTASKEGKRDILAALAEIFNNDQ